jgi:DNA-binding CsgD family transcriptional regulator
MAAIAEDVAGERAVAARYLDEASEVSTRTDYPSALVAVLQARSLRAFLVGDLNGARDAAAEGAAVARDTGDAYGLGMMLVNQATVSLLTDEPVDAKSRLLEALRFSLGTDDRVAQAHLLDALGCHAALVGEAHRAATLLGAAAAAREASGAGRINFLATQVADAEGAMRDRLGASKYASAYAGGRLLSRDAAITLALGEPEPPLEPAEPDPTAGVLAKRETDVARLVAEGLTNKEIGARLFISERTVDAHVRSILNKLGFTSRAQVAAWLASATAGPTAR